MISDSQQGTLPHSTVIAGIGWARFPFSVIARSEATWQSVLSFVTGTKSGRCKGERIAAPVCALARNDRGNRDAVPLAVIARSEATWQSVLLFGWVRICNVARGCGLPRQCAHWRAMTGKPERVPSPVIARKPCGVEIRSLFCGCGCQPKVGVKSSPRGAPVRMWDWSCSYSSG